METACKKNGKKENTRTHKNTRCHGENSRGKDEWGMSATVLSGFYDPSYQLRSERIQTDCPTSTRQSGVLRVDGSACEFCASTVM